MKVAISVGTEYEEQGVELRKDGDCAQYLANDVSIVEPCDGPTPWDVVLALRSGPVVEAHQDRGFPGCRWGDIPYVPIAICSSSRPPAPAAQPWISLPHSRTNGVVLMLVSMQSGAAKKFVARLISLRARGTTDPSAILRGR